MNIINIGHYECLYDDKKVEILGMPTTRGRVTRHQYVQRLGKQLMVWCHKSGTKAGSTAQV